MSGVSQRPGWPQRLTVIWRALTPERRIAVGACVGLLVTMFLPWYQETVVSAGRSASASLSGWAAFSMAEVFMLLLAAAVVGVLIVRAEGRFAEMADADGWIVTLAGGLICLLVVWRILNKQGAHVTGAAVSASGVEWGIFVALAVGGLLTHAGSRMRRADASPQAAPASAVASAGRSTAGADSGTRGARRAAPDRPGPARPSAARERPAAPGAVARQAASMDTPARARPGHPSSPDAPTRARPGRPASPDAPTRARPGRPASPEAPTRARPGRPASPDAPTRARPGRPATPSAAARRESGRPPGPAPRPPSAGSADDAGPRGTRPRRPGGLGAVGFPIPEELIDPPSLHLEEPSEAPTQVFDDQLTIPFDDRDS